MLFHIFDEGLVATVRLVDVCLAGDLPRGVHTQNGYAAVDYFHAVVRHNIRYRSAATDIDFAHLGSLELNTVVRENPANFSDIFRIRVTGTALAASPRELVEYRSFS